MTRVALVHDWLTGMRGGERVLEGLLELYPEAELFTLIHRRGSVSATIEERRVHTSALQRIPGIERHYRYFLPLFPRAIESFDLSGFDLVISSSHCVAKGVRSPAGVPHLCYCHTPMRYAWDQFDAYIGSRRLWRMGRFAARRIASRLRGWDERTAARVDHFVANSSFVRDRIRRYYRRDATVVHPPVEVERFAPGPEPRGEYYVTLSALVPYKRLDLAVEAFTMMGRPLLVIGQGGERARLERLAGPTVRFLGHLPDREVATLLGRARGFVLPGTEDFGIAVVEAQASGTPVVAYAEGGARDSVRAVPRGQEAGDSASGVFFAEPTAHSLADAVTRLEGLRFDPARLAAGARAFSRDRFRTGIRATIERVLRAWPGRIEDGRAA